MSKTIPGVRTIRLEDEPGFRTSPADQGQVVEVSYGWCEGMLLQKIHDRSDRSVRVYLLELDEDYADECAEPWEDADHAITRQRVRIPGFVEVDEGE